MGSPAEADRDKGEGRRYRASREGSFILATVQILGGN